MAKRVITPQEEDFSAWYLDVVREAELSAPSDVRGCGVVKPYGYKIWDLIKQDMARRIEEDGVDNMYFPIFIPMEDIEREADHVDGFAPELAVVTHGGGKELVNKLAIRPTSEVVISKYFAEEIQSYKDLPLRINQWANTVRWEMRPRPFLRWSEFQWQEGHTCFATEEEAREEVQHMLDMYEAVFNEMLALPVFAGRKSEMEKFAGAVDTYTVEVMAKDGRAIQGGTSHYLGNNFAKAFGITYRGSDEQDHEVHQNSWGASWRTIGAVIMAHGDNNGLRLPPNIAPIQVVAVPICREDNQDMVMSYTQGILDELPELRTHMDDRDGMSPGYKFNHWEVKGVPVRLEIGGKEAEDGVVTVYRRDTGEKMQVQRSEVAETVRSLMTEIHDTLFAQANSFREEHIHRIESMDEIANQKGYFLASWSETTDSEKILKEKYSMVSRCQPHDLVGKAPTNSTCFITGEPAKGDWLFAKSY